MTKRFRTLASIALGVGLVTMAATTTVKADMENGTETVPYAINTVTGEKQVNNDSTSADLNVASNENDSNTSVENQDNTFPEHLESYRQDYEALEANHKALVDEYKRLDTVNKQTELSPDNQKVLGQLKQEVPQLHEQVNQAVEKADLSNPIISTNVQKFQEQFKLYENQLSQLKTSQQFLTIHQEELRHLDQLDNQRQAIVANWKST
ncbi:hypothetical protein HMPREF9318_00982 [Streptococcus urinalis FB127-CNA-2]|uniref:Uncharacterized protein n=1 Tax=Streptococcus urinalis 2285-97 TaxID=764291 RepID=G5KH47_9STRE|nr:hypothetical protein [Streptococcus urinalis]EHJ56092.1 hypothetical protein STRUR_0139 [Streptococcus urinalis 2285-97]EKS21028.1 hypothetical protein HMPREF9318_00982 [Streptococcus urinalis FB127-CNA-2]VEF31037.1 Uncharacterised protein [Streptococcus urinalis]